MCCKNCQAVFLSALSLSFQGINTVIQWQQHMAPECYNHRLFGFGKDGGPRFCRPGFHVLDRRTLAPFRTVLGVMASFRLSCASEACDRCIAARTAFVVVSLP
jgi:hypothetical protein